VVKLTYPQSYHSKSAHLPSKKTKTKKNIINIVISSRSNSIQCDWLFHWTGPSVWV